MTTKDQIAYRAPFMSGRIDLHDEEVWVSFVYLRRPFACRFRFAELCGDRVRRLAKINPFAYLLGGSALALSVVLIAVLFHDRNISLGTIWIAMLAISLLILMYRYRTVTWYYIRAKDVHSVPLLFPCPIHLSAPCDELLSTVIDRAADAAKKHKAVPKFEHRLGEAVKNDN